MEVDADADDDDDGMGGSAITGDLLLLLGIEVSRRHVRKSSDSATNSELLLC